MRDIWSRVAEKFAPFNIDVTTVDPGNRNDLQTLRAVVGGNGSWVGGNIVGISYTGSFFSPSLANTIYIFSAKIVGGVKPVAETTAHELGHGFGLEHQSQYDGSGNKTAEYSTNNGDLLRAPVMGNSFASARGVWWNGPSTSSSHLQDDMAYLGSVPLNGFGIRADDHGSTLAVADALGVSGSGLSGSGVIETTADQDWYQLSTGGGSVSFTASVGSYVRSVNSQTGDGSGATLDLALELRDSSGNLITSADTASLGETISASGLAAGTYYLVVKSHGSYGDVGTYDITGIATPQDQTSNPPTANAGGSYAAAEGGSLLLNGGGSTNASGGGTGLTYAWDLDGDGVFGETGTGATRGNETGASPTFSAVGLDGPSTYTIRLKVTETATGLTSSVATSSIAITNVSPTPTISGGPAGNPATSTEGAAISLTASATDPGPSEAVTYVWSVTKDGNAYTAGTGSAFAFTPNDQGSYVVTLTATDKDGGVGTVTKTINATNVAPTASISGAPTTSAEGTAINLTGSATDPGTSDTLGFAWAVTKNGVAYATGSGASFAFTPNDNGTYVVTLTATDKDGAAGTASRTITVTNVAPTPSVGGAPPTSPEGSAIPMTASAVDPGTLDTITYAWSVKKNGVAYSSGTGTSFGLTPNDNGTYVVTLTATDKDGGIGTTTKTIAITNVTPTPSISGAPANSPEGTAIPLTGSATDPGSLDTTFTYAWSVTKDGQAYASGTGASFSFTPNDNASYVVTLTATDKDGGAASTTRTIGVTNAAPTASINGAPATSPEGEAVTLTASATDPGALDTLTYAWAVTKDGAAYASGTGTGFSFTPNDNASYVATLTVTDKDGAATSTSKTIAVTNVGPTLHVTGPSQIIHGDTYTLSFNASDPGADTIGSWSVDWGDGTVDTINRNAISAEHVYATNGTYTIAATATDEDGKFAAVESPQVRVVDTLDPEPPSAMFVPVSTVTAPATTQQFMVVYGDDVQIDESTFGDGDVLVTGPNGFSQLATFVSSAVHMEDGRRTVTYGFTPPGGTWSYTANGNYTLQLQASQIADTAGNFAPAATVGTFTVKLPVPDLGGNTTAAAAYLGIVTQDYQTTSSDYLSKGDRNDYFRVRLKAGATLDIKLYGMTDDADLQLLDGNGRIVQTSARVGTRSEFITRTLAAGTYYLRAYYSGASSTPYWLRVSTAAVGAAPDTVGDTLDSAAYIGIITPPAIGSFAESLGNGDANDFYRFRLKQSVSMNIFLQGLTDDAQLSLLDSSGRAIRTSANTGATNEVVSRTLQAGTYYLRVFSDRAVATQYSLTFSAGSVTAAAPASASRPALFSTNTLKDLLAA